MLKETESVFKVKRRTLIFTLPVSLTGFLLLLLLISGCSPEEPEPTLFERLPASRTGVDFENHLEFRQDFNIYTYRNFYDGGGVAVGDLTGNGLADLYFIHNMGDNQLYANQGDFRFENITEQAGVAGARKWSTGAALVDINGNGLLDIYVTNSGTLDDARNELFVNNGDGTFTEKAAEYGIDDAGYSIHAYFFDYNGSGLLDLYIINNEDEAISAFDLSNLRRYERDDKGGDRLFRNDGGTFTEVTEEAGLYSSIIGFALSAAVSDLNRNGLPDLFIANDFFERDYFYFNNGDGTFTEVGGDERVVRSMSAASMGSDIADVTNNGWPDIYVSDMLPFREDRIKTVTMFEDVGRYNEKVGWGYGHQFTRNVLHLNQGGEHFLEASRLTATESTDWSWAVLMADFNLNGHNDIYVTNGLVQDITNLDYLGEISDQETMRAVIRQEGVDFKHLIDIIPAEPVRNVMFGNQGNLQFSDVTQSWGLDNPTFSSGAAWADLNGNGALDLVVNNVNGPADIFRNRTLEQVPERNWLRISLEGEGQNTQGIGAQLQLWAGDNYWFREHYLQRGFQSSVEPGFHVGLGETSHIDSLLVRWPDGRISRLDGIEARQHITLSQNGAVEGAFPRPGNPIIPGDARPSEQVVRFEPVSENGGIDFEHQRYEYNDFNRERLLYRMRSTEGPALCTGDINGNGIPDVYTGGARDQAGVLWIGQADADFERLQTELFDGHARSEDTACVFFDATGNGLDDLYVVSGGNSHSSASTALVDRMYINQGNLVFESTGQALPVGRQFVSGSVVLAHDFTGNGHQDLFVGTRLRPFSVGLPTDSFLLQGDGTGRFEDVTETYIPELLQAEMVTGAALGDVTGNGIPELVVVGEWMAPAVFSKENGMWTNISGQLGLDGYTGWWNSVALADLNGNGRLDIISGNHGLNSIFRARTDEPVRMWVGDFEGNGMIEHILTINRNGHAYPMALRHDLIEEIPGLADKFPDYASYGGKTIEEVFTREQLERARRLEAAELASMVFWNTGDGFRAERLPLRAQMAPVYAIHASDLTGEGRSEVLLGGNLYDVKPQQGPYDALRGVLIRYDQDTNTLVSYSDKQTGFQVYGEVRSIIKLGDQPLILTARYNDTPLLFRVSNP